LLADVERVLTLPPGAFRPPPKVTSAVVRMRFRHAREDVGDLATFERLVRGGDHVGGGLAERGGDREN
jgi:16S rRNA A1518/A1519 N6-dimethyltransferase RsmA/KsgA/DIM1 with predicted DNA glycosylase/AP lyase activity